MTNFLQPRSIRFRISTRAFDIHHDAVALQASPGHRGQMNGRIDAPFVQPPACFKGTKLAANPSDGRLNSGFFRLTASTSYFAASAAAKARPINPLAPVTTTVFISSAPINNRTKNIRITPIDAEERGGLGVSQAMGDGLIPRQHPHGHVFDNPGRRKGCQPSSHGKNIRNRRAMPG